MCANTTVMTVASVLLATALASPLRAEPITVTDGSVQVSVNIHSARITFEGDGFFLRTGTEDFITPIAMWPLPLGAPIDLGGVWRPSDSRGGEAIFNGVHYPELHFGFGTSHGTFVTDPVTLTGTGPTTVSVPFTFSGVVAGFATAFPDPSDDPVFSTTLVGSGIARAGFLIGPEGAFPVELPGADFQLEYVFSSAAAPIPEPGTMLLVGAGLVMAGARRFVRRP